MSCSRSTWGWVHSNKPSSRVHYLIHQVRSCLHWSIFTFENGGELWQNDNSNVTLLRAAPNLLNIINAPGKGIFAFTLLEYLDYGLGSNLFVGDLPTITTVDPILQSISTESSAVKPLAIAITDGQPAGIWYTSVPYGIGGDIVFEPRTSLSYLDLSDYQTQTRLDMTKDPIGISDDQTWVAYTSAKGIGPVSIAHNFDFSTSVTFPLRPDSDRGAGEAVFSPDNQYVAWKEASGSIAAQPSTFHETVRIASVDGISYYRDTRYELIEHLWVLRNKLARSYRMAGSTDLSPGSPGKQRRKCEYINR